MIRYGERLDCAGAAGVGWLWLSLTTPVWLMAAIGTRPADESCEALLVLAIGFPILVPTSGALFGALHRLLVAGADARSASCPVWGAILGCGAAFLVPDFEGMRLVWLVAAAGFCGALIGEQLRREELRLQSGPPAQEPPPWFFDTEERERERRLFGP